MEFVDNTGHIFSLPSYKEKPIGYEYDEYSYIFWINSNTSHLSVNNYYSEPIYALYTLQSDFTNDELKDDNSELKIEIYCKDSNVFNLISSKKLNEYILSDEYNNLNDYINLNYNDPDDKSKSTTFIKSKLTNEDLYVIKTTEQLVKEDNRTEASPVLDYLMIPIYPIAMSKEDGVWITNIMIHIYDERSGLDEWSYISVGGDFINEYEELVINGTNMGISLPKDILKAVYQESLYNTEFNEALYNEKLKEYLINYMGIKGELGNFNSAINSLKWFGYGDKITISKLLKTDNEFKAQYLNDYFDIYNDVIEAFKKFVSDSLISLRIMINKESDEVYPFETDKIFYGENKPKLISLLDNYDKIKIGNHDMPIEEDDEKYWYYKPYFDFSFIELGIKLTCLSHFYKKYFLPIHLNIHSASLGYRVFANDIKYTSTIGYNITEPLVSIHTKDNEVEFTGNGLHYFTKQIHIIDDKFNEFNTNNDLGEDTEDWYQLDDTCVNIPIRFLHNGYFNCVLILHKKGINKALYESHFSFIESDNTQYSNFIIYPKKLNVKVEQNPVDVKSKYFEYWIDNEFTIDLLVNNKWYGYDFKLKIHNPTIDFGKLRYRYYLNDNNYLLNRIITEGNTDIKKHSLLFADASNINGICETNINGKSLYEALKLDDELSLLYDIDITNTAQIYQYLESNYNLLSPFTQINKLDDDNEKVSFNAYMHNKTLVETNNIDYDIDLYKIIKYHLNNNLIYIDKSFVEKEFYQYIIYYHNGNKHNIIIHKDLLGHNIKFPYKFINNYDDILVYMSGSQTGVLIKTEDIYKIVNYDITNVSINMIEFIYDSLTNSYYNSNDSSEHYIIYDKLYADINMINNKYVSVINLPKLDKYMNSLHLYGLYESITSEENILIYHNNIHMYINGILFEHYKYDKVKEKINNTPDETLKFYISGVNNIDTRYVDVYGLHWINNPNITVHNNSKINIEIEHVPVEIIDRLSQYGLYVKRDYSQLYINNDNEEPLKIWELPDLDEYTTEEFDYYSDAYQSSIGYVYYRTLNDFYNNVQLKSELINDDIKLYIKDDQYYFDDLEIKDINDISKYVSNPLTYKVEFYKTNNGIDELMENISINNIENKEYSKLKVEFTYYKKHIVRNRFYLLSDFIEKNQERFLNNDIDIDIDNNILIISGYDPIHLIKLGEKYSYIENYFNESYIISNQNPSMYWYNLNSNQIESLPAHLNELERYAYDNNSESMDDIINGLDKYYKEFKEKQLIDDRIEARYNYSNYLVKDLTGLSGEFSLQLINSENINNIIQLCLKRIDKDNKEEIIIANSNTIQNNIVLKEDDVEVIIYLQIKNNDTELQNLDNAWFIPKFIKKISNNVRIKYDYTLDNKNEPIEVIINNKKYYYGDNESKYIYNLYKDFFKLKYNIYDVYELDNIAYPRLLNSVYEENDSIKLNMYLDYDFYLMHDNEYWYCLYISKQTIDNARKHSDLKVPESQKTLSFIGYNTNTSYTLMYERSSNEYLLNRLEFISSNGYNHFKTDDIIACYVHNNNRLPFTPYISSKWNIIPMSIGMSMSSQFESNSEMTILSMPANNNKYESGYYNINVRFSLDRDIQHQFKNSAQILIS